MLLSIFRFCILILFNLAHDIRLIDYSSNHSGKSKYIKNLNPSIAEYVRVWKSKLIFTFEVTSVSNIQFENSLTDHIVKADFKFDELEKKNNIIILRKVRSTEYLFYDLLDSFEELKFYNFLLESSEKRIMKYISKGCYPRFNEGEIIYKDLQLEEFMPNDIKNMSKFYKNPNLISLLDLNSINLGIYKIAVVNPKQKGVSDGIAKKTVFKDYLNYPIFRANHPHILKQGKKYRTFHSSVKAYDYFNNYNSDAFDRLYNYDPF